MYCYNCMSRLDKEAPFCPYCGAKADKENLMHQLAAGTVLNGKYLVGNAIGEGGFGITYIGRDLTLNIRIAIKEFYPNGYANRNNTVSNNVTLNYTNKGEYFKQGMDKFLQEAQSVAMFLPERAVVDVRDFFEENDTAYIIMEYLDGITLSERVKQGIMTTEEIVRLMLPVLKTLDKMHSQQILHRDISPDNIMLLKDGTLKLMDFGSARYFSDSGSKTMSIMLKPGYAPYEQYYTKGNQGPWTDVYGICATMYKCITGITPPDSLERISADELKKPSQMGIFIPENIEKAVMSGLAIYPENRCKSIRELIEQLSYTPQKAPAAVDKVQSVKPKVSDEKYKTTFADDKAVDDKNKTTFADSYSVSGRNNDAFTRADSSINKPQKRKSKKLFIILGAALLAIIGAAVGLFVFFVNNYSAVTIEGVWRLEKYYTKGDEASAVEIGSSAKEAIYYSFDSDGNFIFSNGTVTQKGKWSYVGEDGKEVDSKTDNILVYIEGYEDSDKQYSYSFDDTSSEKKLLLETVSSNITQIAEFTYYDSSEIPEYEMPLDESFEPVDELIGKWEDKENDMTIELNKDGSYIIEGKSYKQWGNYVVDTKEKTIAFKQINDGAETILNYYPYTCENNIFKFTANDIDYTFTKQ